MADSADQAQEIEQLERERSIRRVTERQALPGADVPVPDGSCINCRSEIPQERLEAMPEALRCHPCQTQWERT